VLSQQIVKELTDGMVHLFHMVVIFHEVGRGIQLQDAAEQGHNNKEPQQHTKNIRNNYRSCNTYFNEDKTEIITKIKR